MFTIGQHVRHRPSGRVGTIAILYPDRHRARLRLDATPELPVAEMDEVAWHDLEPVTPEPTPMPTPAPSPVPVTLDETREDASDTEPPRRGRRLWPERADGE